MNILTMIPDKILNNTIRDIAGDDVVPLVQLIKGRSHVSEIKIADKLEVTVNNVRNMLYRLEAYNLVTFVKKKDKKKGWYVYFWTLDMGRLRDSTIKRKGGILLKLRERIRRERMGQFFNCPDKHIRVNLENAMENEFKCPECSLQLVSEDNAKLITNMEKRINKLTDEIEILKNLEIKPIVERKLTRETKQPEKTKKKTQKTKKQPKKKTVKKTLIKRKTKKRIKNTKTSSKKTKKKITKKRRSKR